MNILCIYCVILWVYYDIYCVMYLCDILEMVGRLVEMWPGADERFIEWGPILVPHHRRHYQPYEIYSIYILWYILKILWYILWCIPGVERSQIWLTIKVSRSSFVVHGHNVMRNKGWRVNVQSIKCVVVLHLGLLDLKSGNFKPSFHFQGPSDWIWDYFGPQKGPLCT